MHVQEITRLEDAEDLRYEWSALWDRCPSSTPFHSHEWLLSWWRNFGFGELFMLALRDGGRLAGLAPLFIHPLERTVQDQSADTIRQVSPLGIGITDYADFLIEPQLAISGAEMILGHLEKRHGLWDTCDLQGIR